MKRLLPTVLALGALLALFAPAARGAEAPCELVPKVRCFAVESAAAALSPTLEGTDATQAGSHPNLTLDFAVAKDPESAPNAFGLKDAYAATRNVRIETPPGLIGDPNVLGVPQQCTVQELLSFNEEGGGCPNGSQVGIARVLAYQVALEYHEPVYMMQPPGGDVVARLGFVAAIYPTFVDLKVRSQRSDDFGLTAEVVEASAAARLIGAGTTLWGVPADPSHDSERCTVAEALAGCVSSPSRPPGSRPLAFLTNPTRCGVPLSITVSASSWAEPARFGAKSTPFPTITGCDRLPSGPSVEAQTTSHRASSPTGLEVTIRVPAADGANVLEPSQTRDIEIHFPAGIAINPGAADGLGTCSAQQVRFGEAVASECPDAAKLAEAEFEVTGLQRRLEGALYLREPEPGDPFRVWVVADDLGAHVKLSADLEVDKQSGQITSVLLDSPQVPLREAKISLKSGFRAPLATPPTCGTHYVDYELTPWSGGSPVRSSTPTTIDEGCDTGGFSPDLTAGTLDAAAGAFSPFMFTITREDGEQNPRGLDVTLPRGVTASFRGIPRCEGQAAETGQCPAASRIGRVRAAVGAGPAPLWLPQPGKRPTAVYLSGPYRGAPLSIVAVVPRQAGPFDFGDEVVRSAVYVNPVTARATAKADPLPQRIEGIPIGYRMLHVILDRPGFTLNPTGCARSETVAAITSAQGAHASPSSPFAAANCASLPFKPRLGVQLKGGTRRGAHPALRAVFRPRKGDANAASIVVRLPHSVFLDQAHIRTICTRVQYAAGAGNGAGCPPASVYGQVLARTPLFDFPLEGPVFLRSSSHNLPDMVLALHGPPSFPVQVEAVGRIDSVKGGIRSSFEAVPDAPLSEVVLDMQGAKKGLIVNSTDLCQGRYRADARLTAHNGRVQRLRPALRSACKTKPRKHRR